MPFAVTAISIVVLASFVLKTRAVTMPAALLGSLLALAYASTDTPAPFVVFAAFVILGSWGSRWGADAKRRQGVMQEDGGRRGIVHALANCGLGAAIIVAHRLFGLPASRQVAELAACASLAAVFADTMASEIGTWVGGPPRLILTGKTVPVGTDGGVTAVGMIVSLAAGAVAGVISRFFLGAESNALLLVTLAGFAGSIADSIFGASIEPRLGRHGGAWVNLAASVVGASIALIGGR